jgi:hypothetical protein
MPIFPDDLTWQVHQFHGEQAPTTTDDETQGFSCNSFWCDAVNNKFYICISAQESAALWKEITVESVGSGGSLDDVVYVDTGDGDAQMVFCESGVGEIELVEVDV